MFSLFKLNPKRYNGAAFWIQIGFVFFAFIIILKLFQLQIIDSKKLKDKAIQMRQPTKAFSFRGEIVDRNGIRLATDVTLYDIYAHPQYYDKSPYKMADLLAPLLKKKQRELFNKLNQPKESTITLTRNINRDTVAKIKKLKLRGLDIVKKNDRVYPQGILASHILGYVNVDANLYAGVEKTGSHNLESIPDIKPIEYDGRGEIIYDVNTNPEYAALPIKGEKLRLTIDSSIQHVAETQLEKTAKKYNANKGTVIVMNPKNGEILGFAVYPSYDPNEYRKAEQSVVKNWVLSDVYPPGSTFKILTVASALQTGAITPSEKILDTGKIKIAGWEIKNYDYEKKGAPGLIDLKHLFTHSSNIGSLKVSLKIDAQEHYNMLRLFGIGSKTNIDLPGESAGIILNPKKWDLSTHANIGFGYAIATTPIQLASAVASIANNGIWVTPHVIKYTEEEYNKRIKTKRVLSPNIAKTLTHILSDSIEASEAEVGKIPNFKVAGKTGTSRKPKPNGIGYYNDKVFTSFVGYFPVKDPQVLIMVVVDDPKGAEMWGSTVAGPVFNSVATEVARILSLEPDAPGLNIKKTRRKN